MKQKWGMIIFLFLLQGCLDEKYTGNECRQDISFQMKDVPYVLVGEDEVGYRPYYVFIEQLDLFVFAGERPEQEFRYDFNYCREHPVITENIDVNSRQVLFATNLYDSREWNYSFFQGKLLATFSILRNEEPPVLLAAVAELSGKDSVPVELRMMVSRVEIRLNNPPAWITGLDIVVSNVAASVTTDYSLGDTTHIEKKIFFNNTGKGPYQTGVNTLPTYPDKAAVLSIQPLGVAETAPILVDDSRLHLLPGVVTRLDITYDTEEHITVSIEIEGKWEVVDGGSIII